MARDESPPFPRGKTFYDGETIDTTNYSGIWLEGKEWRFEDVDPRAQSGGASARRTSRDVVCRVFRNVSGFALLPKRLFSGNAVAGLNTCRADGYVRLTADVVLGVVDEYLPAAGVPNGDLFWGVVHGPSLVLTDLAAGANNLLPLGTVLVALTGATTGATTAGRVAPQDLTGATSLLANQVQNQIGKGLTARTTANTNADLLVDVTLW